MSDIQALIEEARGYIHPDSAHALYLIGCLADALEVEVALREALRAKVNALADKWEAFADDLESSADARAGLSDAKELATYASAKRRSARDLRALIVQEDTEKERDKRQAMSGTTFLCAACSESLPVSERGATSGGEEWCADCYQSGELA